MYYILLIVAILLYDFLRRMHEFVQGSECISMSSFKNKNYLPKFNEIYDKVTGDYEKKLMPYKKRMRAVLILKYVSYVCALWIFISGIYSVILVDFTLGVSSMAISLILFGVALYTDKYSVIYYAEYLEMYKDTIINHYVRSINKGFGYSLRSSIKKQLYEESYSYPIDVYHYYGSDYVTGVVEGKRTLNLCELYVKHKANKKRETFCGLFGYLKTDYNDEMKVEYDGRNIKYKNIPLNMQVGIENYIKKFEKENRVQFSILMRNGKIFIKLYTGDLMKPSIFFDKVSKDRLWAYYLLIKFTVDITDMINKVRVIK